MESINLRRNFSLKILLRMVILASVATGILVWKWDFINQVYFRDQLTSTGLLINGAILVLFSLGILRMIGIFLSYAFEESTLIKFVKNLEQEPDTPLQGISGKSIVARRYRTMHRLFAANCPINHNALASTLVASESTRNSLPKFINNVLILTGVFGTIVSLSIALIGASDLLASAITTGSMGMVIHGMSTALSTTITAIVCYLYFGYFYLKLHDVQTNLISAVEQVTATYLVPNFQVHSESVLYEFSGLIRSLQRLVSQLELSQATLETLEKHIVETLDGYQSTIPYLSTEMNDIKRVLRRGFRLPDKT